MRLVRSLALVTLLVACSGSPSGTSGSAAAAPTQRAGDARVERRTVVQRTPGGGTVTRTVTTTTRVEDAQPPPARPADPYPADPLVRFNVEEVNRYRARNHLPPLLYDAKISAFAVDGSRRLAKDHTPHAHFAASAKGSGVFGSRSAENQGDPAGVPALDADPVQSGKRQIALLLDIMFKEGPGGGHHDNMMNPRYRRIGVGLHVAGGKLYLTNDFSD